MSWNRQVQHILASASPSGRASVWDLRKNDLIIKVSDHSNRVRPSSCTHTKSYSFSAVESGAVCSPESVYDRVLFFCFFSDALLGAGLEPRSCHSAGRGLGGRPAAGHPDVGLTFCYLSSEDFRESHTVNKPVQKQR